MANTVEGKPNVQGPYSQSIFRLRIRLSMPTSTVTFWGVWGRTFGANVLACGTLAFGCSIMTTHSCVVWSQSVGNAQTPHHLHSPDCLPATSSSSPRCLSSNWRVAVLTQCRRSKVLRRWCWMPLKNATQSVAGILGAQGAQGDYLGGDGDQI